MTEEMEELELTPATKSPHGYLTSPLTDNIHMTDEGYLVIVGCPIARTGWQKYAVKDLPQDRAEQLGVDVSNPGASIDLYRPAREVFNHEFLASLNGKPITDGHPPNGEFVDPKNFAKYVCGHIQNVRKGTEQMEDGEVPIIADLVISEAKLIDKVKNKTAREISLGYDFSIDRDGDKIIQCDMMGNHNAVVPKGRAGELIRIEDAAPEESDDVAAVAYLAALDAKTSLPTNPAPATEGIEAAKAYPPISINFHKEKHPVAKQNKLLRLFMGKHLIEMARATDADPEKIMEAAEALHEDPEPADDKKKAKDGELPEALKEHQFKAKDKKSKDDDDDDEPMDDDDDDDEPMDDARKAAHDALDAILDRTEGTETGVPAKDRKKAADKKSKDSDVAELKKLLDEFLSEEEEEPEHAADTEELEKTLEGEDEEPCPDCGEAHDSEECPGEEEVESGEEVMDEEGESPDPDSDDDQEDVEDRRKARDRAKATDGAKEVLRMLRPYAARSTDKAFRATFNKASDVVNKSSRASAGSYGMFATSARARDKAPRNPNPDRTRAADGEGFDHNAKLQAFYDSARKGGK